MATVSLWWKAFSLALLMSLVYASGFDIAGCADAVATTSQLILAGTELVNVTEWACGPTTIPARKSISVPLHARNLGKRWDPSQGCPVADISCTPPVPPPPPRSPIKLSDCQAWDTLLTTNPSTFTVGPNNAMTWVGSQSQTCIWVLVNTASTTLTWSTTTAVRHLHP
ncbi:hypothetical protein SISSUDRAFT_1056265 [Sistotremastrum suecicum HHB10207 ss-3]|uniref:Uncharacterized protein n=1 Tax=Sistotremastrum suecicum HHB10207 ss-3 TaxID=1314776 RepID=A0A165X322_9AGAM|nr:hypothetical protein SISSUDRAFT_1056265 [Sistotremastrum suecicum HHB10207 ss-3]